jgi:atypical dual specificity phosphatase
MINKQKMCLTRTMETMSYHWDGTNINDLNFSWVIDGKLAGHREPSSDEELIWLKNLRILALVRMAEKDKSKVSSLQITHLGLLDCHEPVPDFTAPTIPQINRMVEFITHSVSNGRPVGVSCGAGLGRTGTILACYLVNQGWDSDEAINEVRAKRLGSIETGEQEKVIKAYASNMRK